VLLFGALIPGIQHAGGVRTCAFRQIKLSHKARARATSEFDVAVHPLYQLAHDINPYPTPAAATMTNEKLSQLIEIAGKSAAIIADSNLCLALTSSVDLNIDLSGLTVSNRVLNQVREHTLKRARVCQNDGVTVLLDRQIRPMPAQVVN
jgi:hypothetical protein